VKISTEDKFYIQSINRALTIVDVIGKSSDAGLTLTTISNQTKLHISTVYRILQNLISWNYVKEGEGGIYTLGYELITLGNIAKENIGIRNVAHQFLEELGDSTKETIYLAILDEINDQVMYIDKIDSKGNIKLAAGIGSRNSIHSTANGKVLVSAYSDERIKSMLAASGMPTHTDSTITDVETYLNEVRKVREEGYAIDNLENEPGVRCVAAPIYDYRKKIIASISLSGISSAITLETIEDKYKQMVIETTEKISKELGFRK